MEGACPHERARPFFFLRLVRALETALPTAGGRTTRSGEVARPGTTGVSRTPTEAGGLSGAGISPSGSERVPALSAAHGARMIPGRAHRLAPLLFAAVLASCGDDEPTAPVVDPAPAAVTVSPASDSLAVAGTLQLQAAVTDAQGNELTGAAVSWASSDASVASVSSSGEVTGEASGTADITAAVGGLSATARIQVFAGLGEVDDAGGTVSAAGGAGAGGATLEVPAGAVPGGTTITATPVDAGGVAAGAVSGTAWDFGPDGLDFGTDATLTLAWDAADLPAGADPAGLVVVRSDGGSLERLGGIVVDDVAGTVQASVPGFSSFAVCLPAGPNLCGGDPVADLDLALSASATAPAVGDTLTYTVAVANQGPGDLPAGTVTLAASGPVDYAPGYVVPGGCVADAGQADVGLACSLAALAVGESVSFDLRVVANGQGDVVATAGSAPASPATDPAPSNDTAELALTVSPASGPVLVLSPDSLHFQVLDIQDGGTSPSSSASVISNGGPGTLEGLGTAVTYTDGSTGWLTASILENQNGSFAVAEVDQTGLAQGTYTAEIAVSSANAVNSPGAVAVVMQVLPGADLGTAVNNVPDSVNVGDTIRYEVVVSNAGPAAAPEAELDFVIIGTTTVPGTDLIPDGCEFLDLSNEFGDRSRYLCTITDLAAGDSRTVTLVAIPRTSGQPISFGANTFLVSGALDPELQPAVTGSTGVR